jgi:hypothetical protein
MPLEPLRFIHAAGLLVDHQLSDVPDLADAERQIVEEATVTSFERIIAAAIEQRVDFIILAGDSFDAAVQSLRAEVLLRRGWERLSERNIRVFIAPGAADPRAAWRAIKNLPGNVTTLLETNDEPVAVIRDGKVIATVTAFDLRSLRTRNKQDGNAAAEADAHRGPLKIGTLIVDERTSPASGAELFGGARADSENALDGGLGKAIVACRLDYLALGGIGTRSMIATRSGIAHHPGCTQSMTESGTGPRGATIVEIDEAGAVRSTFLPTAVVRREQFRLNIDVETTRNQLIAQFRDAMENCRAEPGELIWLVRWVVRGEGPMREILLDEPQRIQLIEAAALFDSTASQPRIIHTFDFVKDARAIDSPTRGEALLLEFRSTLDESAPASRAAAAACFAAERPTNPVWTRTLELLMRNVDGEFAAADARQLGELWFAGAAEETPAL